MYENGTHFKTLKGVLKIKLQQREIKCSFHTRIIITLLKKHSVLKKTFSICGNIQFSHASNVNLKWVCNDKQAHTKLLKATFAQMVLKVSVSTSTSLCIGFFLNHL